MENTWLLILFNLVCFYFSEWELWLFFLFSPRALSSTIGYSDCFLHWQWADHWGTGRKVSWINKPLVRLFLPPLTACLLSSRSQEPHSVLQSTIYSSFLPFLQLCASCSARYLYSFTRWWALGWDQASKMLCTVSAQDLVLLWQRGRVGNWRSHPSESQFAFMRRVVCCLLPPECFLWISREIWSWNRAAGAFQWCPGEVCVIWTTERSEG